MKKILYVLPRENYFKLGNNGRVSHATGFISGLLDNGVEVSVISGDGLFELFDHYKSNPKLTYLPIWEFQSSRFAATRGVIVTAKFIAKNYRDFDVVTIRYSAKTGWLFVLLLKLSGISNWGFEVNSLISHNISNPVLIEISKIIEKIIFKFVPYCNVVSRKIKEDVGIKNNILVLPNGGPKNYLGSLVNRDDADSSINLYYFGKVKTYYDFDMLIELLKRRPEIRLNIVGENSSDLESLENISYLGEYNNITSLLKGMVFPSHSFLVLPFREGISAEIGSPTKLYEMISMGMPILYRPNTGQLKDTLGNNSCGLFYSSANELEEIVDGLVSNDKQFAVSTLDEQTYKDRFTWASRCKVFIRYISENKILNRR